MIETAVIAAKAKAIWEAVKKAAGALIKSREGKELIKDERFRQFFLGYSPNARIINTSGDVYFGEIKNTPTIIVNQFKNGESSHEPKKSINILESKFFGRVETFRREEPKGLKLQKINKFLPYLSADLKNILNLSFYVKYLYDSNNSVEASRVRHDIGEQYGKNGRIVCNLYTSGYVDDMTEYLDKLYEGDEEKIKAEINKEIEHFVANSEHIFFINPGHDAEDIAARIMRFLQLEKEYIAVHSGGENIEKAKEILEEIRKEIPENYELIEETPKKILFTFKLKIRK